MGAFVDRTGQRYGKLVAVKQEGFNKFGLALWQCVCDCGEISLVHTGNLGSGNTQSCGCAKVKHGLSRIGRKNTPEYSAWYDAKYRCHNSESPGYKDYGARGITMCDEWRDNYSAFLSHMGLKPSPDHSLDRTDNDSGYQPGNCRWVTWEEQANNRRPRRTS